MTHDAPTIPAGAGRGRTLSPLSAALLGLASLLLLPAAASAQQDPVPAFDAPDGPEVSVQVEGVNFRAQPRATLTLTRQAHVGVFEVEPGVGATLLWPHRDRAAPVAGGSHGFRLNGPRMATYRSLMLTHLGRSFLFRSANQQEVHLVAVVSERPLRTDRLLSGRVFGHDDPGATAGEVVDALLSRVLADPLEAAWSYDRLSFPRFWDGQLAAATPLLGPPFLAVHVPLDPGLDLARRSACVPGLLGLGALSSFQGFPTFREDGSCPAVREGSPRTDRGRSLTRSADRPSEEPRTLRDAEPAAEAGSVAGRDDVEPGGGSGLPAETLRRLRRLADARTAPSDRPGAADFGTLARELADAGIDIPARRVRDRSDRRADAREARQLRARLNRIRRARRMQAARSGRPLRDPAGAGIPRGTRLEELELGELRSVAERAGVRVRRHGDDDPPAGRNASDGQIDREAIRRDAREGRDRNRQEAEGRRPSAGEDRPEQESGEEE